MPQPLLTNQAQLQALLARQRFQPARSAGQNFLVCDEVVEAALTATGAGPSNVTELGAGVGTLTQALVAAKHTVRAIERDRTLAAILPTVLTPAQRQHLELVVADLRHTNWTWISPYQLAGNIPYNLSGFIIRRLTELTPAPTQAVFLVQQEVADRLCAAPPDMHLMSVALQLWGAPSLLLRVPASCFWPAPQVNSALVMIVPHAAVLPTATREGIMHLARALFQNRRKQLGGTLSSFLQQPREYADRLLPTIGSSATQRPQELSVAQWIKLHGAIREMTKPE